LRICYFIASSQTRGRISNLLLLLLVLASAFPLRSHSRGTQTHILLSQFLGLPQPGRPGPRIYILQEQGGPVIPPSTGFPFRRLLRLSGLPWGYTNPPRHRVRSTVGANSVHSTETAVASILSTNPCGGGLEYLHRSPASRKRRQKRNPVAGGITGLPCFWGI
jgi:hypothetical protein